MKSLEDAKKICDDYGVDLAAIVRGIQPICFENAVWAYTLGAAIAIKKGQSKFDCVTGKPQVPFQCQA